MKAIIFGLFSLSFLIIIYLDASWWMYVLYVLLSLGFIEELK